MNNTSEILKDFYLNKHTVDRFVDHFHIFDNL